MTDSQSLRTIANGFIDGMCSCNVPSGTLTGHTLGCTVAQYRADLKRVLKLADRLEQKHPLTKKQWLEARCA